MQKIVSTTNVYEKYSNQIFHFLFFSRKKLSANDNKNIMHSYHVSKEIKTLNTVNMVKND